MRVGGTCLKYFKRGWNRKELRGNKDFKKWGQAGSRGGHLKNGGEPPYELCLIFNLNNLLSLVCLCVFVFEVNFFTLQYF